MAKIGFKGQLTGSVGPVYYRTFNGNSYIQTKPGRGNVKQTVATQKSASDFGRASSMAKAIRESLFPVLQHHSDTAFYRRFAAKVNAATQDGNPQPKGSRSLIDGNLALLSHIDCNTASPFSEYCKLSAELSLSDSNVLTISLPELQATESITTYADATDAELAFLVTVINPQDNTQTQAELFKLAIPLTNATISARQWTTASLPENQLIVVAAAVFYYRNNSLAGMIGLNGKGFHPCEVVGVFRSL